MDISFEIIYNKNIEHRKLVYLEDDCSFDMEPIYKEIDFELIVNKLSLSVLNFRIIQLWGFCGLSNLMKSEYQVPSFKKGILKIKQNLEHGFSYGLNNEDFPIYINVHSGWICLGNPKIGGKAVEFIDNCVAVINEDGILVTLWLKPLTLPSFLYS